MIRLYLCISPEEADISSSCSCSSCSVSSSSSCFLFLLLFCKKQVSLRGCFQKLLEIKRGDGLFFLSCFFLPLSRTPLISRSTSMTKTRLLFMVRAKLIEDAKTLRSFGEMPPEGGKKAGGKTMSKRYPWRSSFFVFRWQQRWRQPNLG